MTLLVGPSQSATEAHHIAKRCCWVQASVASLACGAVLGDIGARRAAHPGRAAVGLHAALATKVSLRTAKLQSGGPGSGWRHRARPMLQPGPSQWHLRAAGACASTPTDHPSIQLRFAASTAATRPAAAHLCSAVGAEAAALAVDGALPRRPPGGREGALGHHRPAVRPAAARGPALLVRIGRTPHAVVPAARLILRGRWCRPGPATVRAGVA